ncbi:hypothetical protein [Actinopolymorpha rutila]|uniref:Uncharacterized protein n=1 Tax=Actinopolymorpha rutila TaxID=446787 RepID=A0A852ZAF7_9ACTN|nr:hypothetical protein [Actinopolymorpha rutila]NYH88738.1 hypothetical protein [Actinopolymorpha rutila]
MPDDHLSASRAYDDHAVPDAGELASVERSDRWRPGRHRRPRPTLVVASVLSSVVAAGAAATGVGWYVLGGGHDERGTLAASTLRPGGPTQAPAPTGAVRGPLGSTAHAAGEGLWTAQMLPAPFLPAAAQRPGAAGVSLALLGLPATLPNAQPNTLPNALSNPGPGAPTSQEVPPATSPFVLAGGPPMAPGVTGPGTAAPHTATPGQTRTPERPGGRTGDPTATGTPTPTASPTPTDKPEPTRSPTKDPSPTSTPTPTRKPEPTRTPTPTRTPEPTRSPTSDPTPTKKPLPKLPLPLPKSPTIPVPDLP